jgi:hypothetical protein
LAVATDDDSQFFLPANKRVDTLAARIYTSHNLLLCSQHSPFDIGFKRETKKLKKYGDILRRTQYLVKYSTHKVGPFDTFFK